MEDVTSNSRKARRQESARRRERMAPLRGRMRSLEKRVDGARSAAAKLEAILHNPETYETESTAELARLMQDRARLVADIAKWEEDWLHLAEELEALEAAG